MSALAIPGIENSIATMLWARAEASGERMAVVERGSSTDYRALRMRATSVALHLRGLGIRPDDRVAIFLERGAEAAAAFFGVAAAGAIAVIVNETLRPRQIEHILRHSRARVLITSVDLLARQPRALESEATVIFAGEIHEKGDLAPLGLRWTIAVTFSPSTGIR